MHEKNRICFNNYEIAASLKNEITLARNMMQKLWNERGYTDKEVLDASIKVDTLLNRYEQLRNEKV